VHLWRRLKYLLPAVRRAEDREMHEELQALAAIAERAELGNLTLAAEQGRDAWGWTWLDRLVQDLSYALRTMRNSPGFTATAVVSLGLGIGANTAIFSLIDALMLRWLPVRDPQQLVLVGFQTTGAADFAQSFSYAIARALDEQKEIFEGAAGFSGASFRVEDAGATSKVQGAWVTGAYYETLGLHPVIGRLLRRDDDESGRPLVCVISFGYWERRFARDAAVIGDTLRLNGVPVTIAGVSPAGFTGANVGSVADVTLPVAALPLVQPDAAPLLGAGNFWLRVVARPRSGLPAAQTRTRLAAEWPRIAEEVISRGWPAARRKEFVQAKLELTAGGTGWTFLRSMFVRPLLILMAVVGLVLLIACANVANLLLARATARHREIAIRLSIGAGRARIVRQLLTESVVLSLMGAALGIGLAWVGSRFLVSIVSSGPLQVVFDLTPNWHVLVFTSAVAIGTGVLFGLAPALQTTAAGPSPVLKQDDARMSRSRSRLLSVLLTAQIALSMLLLTGAGLFGRTLRNLQNLDPGFRQEGVLLVQLEGRRTAVTDDILERVQRLPGVIAASMSTHTPLSGATWSEPAVPRGQVLPERDNAYFIGAAPRFFGTLQTTLIAGREFEQHDRSSGASVAIVNEAYASRYFRGRNPVGEHLSARVRGSITDLEIVGVAKNVNLAGLRAAPPPTVYVPYAQLTGDVPTTLEIRASGSLAQVAAAVRNALQVPNTPMEIRTLSEQVNAAIVRERMMATLSGAFGILALVLAAVGVYGLLAYDVVRRTTDIGIRMALGAQRSAVISAVVKDAIRLVAFGVFAGMPMAWAGSRAVQSMLFGLAPTDPATMGSAAIVLLAAGMLAAYLPARRASRLDPMAALRHE
jgi:putative ABC transport system permease protein